MSRYNRVSLICRRSKQDAYPLVGDAAPAGSGCGDTAGAGAMAGAVSGAVCISRWESVTALKRRAVCLPYCAREIPKPDWHLHSFKKETKRCKGDLSGSSL